MVLFTRSIAVVTAVLGALPAMAAPSLTKRSVVAAGGGTLPRPNLADVVADDNKLTCLIKVFAALQKKTGPDSYDDVAGIHGFSLASGDWQGDSIPENSSNREHKGPTGYCPHSSALFPTWHRPFLFHMEKLLWDLAQDECTGAARSSFRIPYWDWAAVTNIPEIFMQQKVTINGGKDEVDNPLFNYDFHNNPPAGVSAPTIRGSTDQAPNRDNEAVANQRVEDLLTGPAIRSKVYTTLTDTNINYMRFSNKIFDDSGSDTSDYDSLETCHDYIHSATGGTSGTMTFTTSSAFDPMFWFHHCNVDRLFAIWQTLNNDTWIEPGAQAGFTETSNLAPFPNGNTYFNSRDVRDWTKWGYTYTDTQGGIAAVKARVNALYQNPNLRSGTSTKRRSVPVRARGEDCDKDKDQKGGDSYKPASHGSDDRDHSRPSHGGKGNGGKDHGGKGGRGGRKYDGHRLSTYPEPSSWQSHRYKIINTKDQYTSYTCNVKVHSEAYDGPYKVLFYIGDSCKKGGWKQDKGEFYKADDYVGYYTSFGVPKGQSMHMNVTYAGTVPLTNACMNLVTQGKIPDMNEETVSKYLKTNMCYKVVGNDDKEIDSKEIKGLGLHVASREITLAKSDDEFPTYGKSKKIHTLY